VATRIFLAGIIQGSIQEDKIHQQDYRSEIKEVLRRHVPDAEAFCPIENHPESLGYTFEQGREVFNFLINRAAESDVVLAFVPEASMGTAVEMWETRKRGRLVLTISPMRKNWVVKYFSHRVFATIEEFERFARSGELADLIARHYADAAAENHADAE
jgi:hypothetical protein